MDKPQQHKQYPGLDVIKFVMALLVAWRHMIQFFYGSDSFWYTIIVSWLSNLAVPMFFTISGYFLFQKTDPLRGNHADASSVWRYVGRVLRMYVLWSLIYLPVDWHNWYYSESPQVAQGIISWLHSFLFNSTVVQLWYLPALAVAVLLVWYLAKFCHGFLWPLGIGLVLFICGTLGDNWYFNQRLPQVMQQGLRLYQYYFLTMRNGVFYGTFFMALGLWFAKHQGRLSFPMSLTGAILSIALMYLEVTNFYNTNFVFCSVPTTFFLFQATQEALLSSRPLFFMLRGMSEWIYLVHFYFFYLVVWTYPLNPIPYNLRNLTIMIWVAILVFSFGMTALCKSGRFRLLRWLI